MRQLWPEQAKALGYEGIILHTNGHVYSMKNEVGYRIVVGSPSYESACDRAALLPAASASTANGPSVHAEADKGQGTSE